VRLDALTVSPNTTPSVGPNVTTNLPSLPTPSLKLLKLVMPTFHGDSLRWHEFWDCSESSIHTIPTLGSVDKFNYLLGLLGGDDKCCIEGLSLPALSYEIAVTF
jgi:hypothetical protein